jgi:CheY-like chemotaxis protein
MDADEVRILVVDDVADAAEALAALLQCDGYSVMTAASGKRALEVVGEFAPHCVLLDIGMPGLSGLEVAARLRSVHGSSIVVIAVTGWGKDDDKFSAAFAEFDYYLRKPLELTALRKVLSPLV